jgi:hypothetical protein
MLQFVNTGDCLYPKPQEKSPGSRNKNSGKNIISRLSFLPLLSAGLARLIPLAGQTVL